METELEKRAHPRNYLLSDDWRLLFYDHAFFLRESFSGMGNHCRSPFQCFPVYHVFLHLLAADRTVSRKRAGTHLKFAAF